MTVLNLLHERVKIEIPAIIRILLGGTRLPLACDTNTIASELYRWRISQLQWTTACLAAMAPQTEDSTAWPLPFIPLMVVPKMY